MNIEFKREVEQKKEYDIIVAGGGVAGAAAALAAARCGKSVLLIEKTVILGGLATSGLVNFFVPMCNGRGTKIIKGMAEEFLRLSIKDGFNDLGEEWNGDNPGEKAKGRYCTSYSAPIFAMALTEILSKSGVNILFDTVVIDAVMKGNTAEGLIVENKSGLSYYPAKMIIDTTGDADVLKCAGVPCVTGGNYNTYYGFKADAASCEKTSKSGDFARLPMHHFAGDADLYGRNQPDGMPLWDGTDAADVTNYVIQNQIEFLKKLRKEDEEKQRNVSARDILLIPSMPQFRTTRRIDGDYTFSEEDKYRHFDDSIGAICDFDRKYFLYEVPYRTMIKSGYPNIITAGRSAAGKGYGWDVLRVIPPAIITGQAAGTACALAIDSGKDICKVDIERLQELLSEQDVDIHFDDALIPEDTNLVEKSDIEHF